MIILRGSARAPARRQPFHLVHMPCRMYNQACYSLKLVALQLWFVFPSGMNAGIGKI